MTENIKRILTTAAMLVIAGGAVLGEYYGLHSVRWLMLAIVGGMIFEFAFCALKHPRKKLNLVTLACVFAWMILMGFAAYNVGGRPWIILLLLMIIAAADVGAWFFGRLLGGDKMWERLSSGKTWAGQIAGIACGTFAAVMYGLLGADTFMPQLMWIGIGVALLSQYGDLTASWLKRKMGVKDFSSLLPGHGGILDRFDGWIYVLPIIWLVMF